MNQNSFSDGAAAFLVKSLENNSAVLIQGVGRVLNETKAHV